ncbi:MAG: tetratricopeptide repeat protein [Candidatus Melainabacteria bacterium]|nr:tetratricopeptide repeat protein [Candidatus Melainabacteria bacterium]
MDSQLPPKDLPRDLSAREYFELGKQYKAIGWIGHSRKALQMAMECDDKGNIAQKALTFMKTRLPLKEVPQEAVAANIEGYNNMLTNPKAAKQIWWRLTEEYPDFEWPFSNLASLILNEGDIAEAKKLLEQAIQLNPCYINALLHLANCDAIQMDYKNAITYIDRILELEPENEQALAQKQTINKVARLTGQGPDLGD